MKTILAAAIFHLLFISFSMANGGLSPERQEAKARGSAGVDEVYLDELKTRESGLKREQETRETMKENPRNEAMVESFGQIDSKEDDQERQEEKIIEERQKAREGEADGVEYDKKRVWR